MPLDPLTNFFVETHPLGSQLRLWCDYPATTPTDAVIVVFRSTSAITAAIVANYFSTLALPAGVIIQVFDYDKAKGVMDYGNRDNRIINGTRYYYAAALGQASADGASWTDYSTALFKDGVPANSFVSRVIDPKYAVLNTIKNILCPYMGMTEGKDVFVEISATPLTGTYPSIVISRGNVIEYASYLGNLIEDMRKRSEEEPATETESYEEYGSMLKDILIIEWASPNLDHRDLIHNAFIGCGQSFVDNLIGQEQIVDVDLELTGDNEAVNEAERIYIGGATIGIIFEPRTSVKELPIIRETTIETEIEPLEES